jgi:dTDP-glucose 4,6-dehydratase
MRILVTGGAGFIGCHFVKHVLAARPDDEVLVLDALTYAGDLDNLGDGLRDDPRFSFWYGNVTNADLVQDLVRRADAVVHFAAESHVARSIYDNSLFFVTDVLGTQTIANAVAKSDVRVFIHISTSEVYGTALEEPMTEEHPLNPLSPYASAKTGADRLVYSYRATYGIPAVIVRPFNQYGPNQHLEKVIPRFITSALDGVPLTVHGSGKAMRDFTFVGDTVAALALLLDAEPAGDCCPVYNIGTGQSLSVMAIAEAVCDLTGRERSLIEHIGDRPGQVSKHVADAGRFCEAFGWRPQVDFNEGLQQTIAWYAVNESWWRKQAWMKHVPVRTADGDVEIH